MTDVEAIEKALRLLTSAPDGISEQHYAEALIASNALCDIRNRLVLVETLLENIVIASKLKNGNDDLDRTIEAAAYYILAGEEKDERYGNKTTD